MYLKLNRHFFLALGISFAFIACNSEDKKTEESKTTDSTATAPTTVATPAAEETIDAVKVAPNLYKVVSDTMGIRVLEATYKPGDSSVLHSHPVNALYVMQGGTAEFILKDGTKNTLEMKTGISGIRGYDLHSVKNTGKTTLKVLLVEVNRPMGTAAADAAMDATKVAPDLYKVKNDSLGIRILEINYKPGQSSAIHSHPDNVLYVISGSKTEFTAKDGTKSTSELKSGTIAITPAGSHSVKNIGSAAVKVILFEVNRPIK